MKVVFNYVKSNLIYPGIESPTPEVTEVQDVYTVVITRKITEDRLQVLEKYLVKATE